MSDRTDPLPATAINPAFDRWLAAALLAVWAVFTISRQWGVWAEDLSAVYIAGWLWQTGQADLIYDAPKIFFGGIAESWKPAMAALGIEDKVSFAYVYPPLWAVLIAPVTAWLGPQGFLDAATLVQIPMLAGSIFLAGRLLKPERMPWIVWAGLGIAILAFTIHALVAIWHNQPTITVGFLVLLAFERLDRGHPIAAGAALALAAAIKLTPAAFILVFLLDRQFRAVVAFTITGGALGLLSIALAGWPAHAAFLDSLGLVKGVALLSAINISLNTAILSAGSALGWLPYPDPDLPQIVYRDTIPAWLGPALGAAALALIAVFTRALAPLDGRLRRGIGLFALAIILALFGPLGWLHYYVMPMLLLPALVGLLPVAAGAALTALVFLSSLSAIFGQIGVLPWPIANYTWAMCTIWLLVLAALHHAARLARSQRE